MGNGHFSEGQPASTIYLTVSFRFHADATMIQEWQQSFEQASALLRSATNGHHQLGPFVYVNDSGGSDPDIWVGSYQQSGSGGYHVLGTPHRIMTFDRIVRYRPYEIVHELGHHLYALRDEYLHPNGNSGAGCTNNPNSGACIMEWSWRQGDRFGDGNANPANAGPTEGQVRRFCNAANHDPDGDTWQQNTWHQPCWETMVSLYPDLALPAVQPMILFAAAPQPVPAAPMPQPEAAAPIELLPEQRFVLAIGRPGSEAGQWLAEARNGATWWVDQAAAGDLLGIVSFAGTAAVEYPLYRIQGEEDRQRARQAIEHIEPGGQAALEAGLRAALDQVRTDRGRAATQVVVLVARDPVVSDAASLEKLVQEAVNNGVQVHTVGTGSPSAIALLQQIAQHTSGSFYPIDPALPLADQALQVRLALHEMAGNAGANRALLASGYRQIGLETREEQVYVEPGSERAVLAVSWRNPADELYLDLRSSGGRLITPDSPPDGVRPIYSQGHPSRGYEIARPAPGTWTLVVRRAPVEGAGEFALFAFSQNPRIAGGLSASQEVYAPGEAIALNLLVYFDQPVTGLAVEATVRPPGQDPVPLQFGDDGNPELGDEMAGDALYSALWPDTRRPGIYTFRAVARSGGDTTGYATVHEQRDEEQDYEPEPVPRFRREFTLAVRVREQPAGGDKADAAL